MAYGQGGYGRSGYSNSQSRGNYSNGYQKSAPTAAPIDVPTEIKRRLDLYQEFKRVATESGIPQDEFLMMAPMLGGWVTSIILKQDKGR